MAGYFDHNATTPVSTAAREAWLEAVERHWENPSGLYREAGVVKRKLEELREELASYMGYGPERVVFNSGATEGNNAVFRAETGDSRVLLGGVEHPSVRDAARENLGRRVVELSVSGAGVTEVEAIEKELGAGDVGLVSVMAANNETGVLQPWGVIRELCHSAGVRYHCDASQWIGKLALGGFAHCDLVTGSGHKFGGPKGVGFLVVPADGEAGFRSQSGGPQEAGYRGGTEDYPSIVAMMAALRERLTIDGVGMSVDRDWFESELKTRIAGVRVVGEGSERLWNTSMIVMPDHRNVKWLTRLSGLGFALSTGSACSSGRENPSHVMEAMGLDYEEMGRVLRVSAGVETKRSDWASLVEAFEGVWGQLERGERPSGSRSLAEL
ncbi:MAG: aminotransferase class V-fold PLP-dependent enzyme [Verrucomicrobiota bacterium]